MTARQFYQNFRSDDTLSPLSHRLLKGIFDDHPVHVLDFGMGSGKHLDVLHRAKVCTIGIDISMINVIRANAKYELPCVVCSDETYLRNLANVDVVFTCSVLDHIKDVDGIIDEFKRICNKSVILAETNDTPSVFYYPHDYESYGFTKLDFEWRSDGDGATYYLWKWVKGEGDTMQLNDDLACVAE